MDALEAAIVLLKYANKGLTVATTGLRVAAATSSVVDSVGRLGLDLLEMESGRTSKGRLVVHVAMDAAMLGADISEAKRSAAALRHHWSPEEKSETPYYEQFMESHPTNACYTRYFGPTYCAKREARHRNDEAVRSFVTIEKPIFMISSLFAYGLRYGARRVPPNDFPEEFPRRAVQTIEGFAQFALLDGDASDRSAEIDYSKDLSWYFHRNPIINGVVLTVSQAKLRAWKRNHMLELVWRLGEAGWFSR